jgi:YggT family protein
MSGLLVASTRSSIADYVLALATVYWILVIAWILWSWIQLLGIRPGYNRYLMAIVGFVDDAVRPFLAIFRRFIPPIGGFDLSPIVALFVLRFVSVTIADAIRG